MLLGVHVDCRDRDQDPDGIGITAVVELPHEAGDPVLVVPEVDLRPLRRIDALIQHDRVIDHRTERLDEVRVLLRTEHRVRLTDLVDLVSHLDHRHAELHQHLREGVVGGVVLGVGLLEDGQRVRTVGAGLVDEELGEPLTELADRDLVIDEAQEGLEVEVLDLTDRGPVLESVHAHVILLFL